MKVLENKIIRKLENRTDEVRRRVERIKHR
jgi:hypothetical protein